MIEIIKNRYTLSAAETLTTDILQKIIKHFQSTEYGRMRKCGKYYKGEQEIENRIQKEKWQPNNKIVKNYCAPIVESFRGYSTGIPVTYEIDNKEDIDEYYLDMFKDILDDNDYINSDSEWYRNGLIYGCAYQLVYVKEDGSINWKNLQPENVILIYSQDVDERLLYAAVISEVRLWSNGKTEYDIDLYDDNFIYHFHSIKLGGVLNITAEPTEHGLGMVPVVPFYINDDCSGVFESVYSLQDAVNKLLSDEVNNFESFVDAILVIQGSELDDAGVEAIRNGTARVLQFPSVDTGSNPDAKYLTKNVSETQVQELIDELHTAIHTITNCPDFSSEEFNSGVSSGVALQYKLVGFNNVASSMEGHFKKALGTRNKVLNNILRMFYNIELEISTTFTHNLPNNIADTVANIVNLYTQGLISRETALSWLPADMVPDPELEAEKIESESDPYLSAFAPQGEQSVEDEPDVRTERVEEEEE